MKTKIYNIEGKEVGQLEMSERVFNVSANADLIHQVVVAQMANSRQLVAHTKTRADVRGGGKKPWKQKGTGRARHGSTRSPIWKGGGVVFGPSNERNYTQRINKKMKTKALFMVLSEKLKNNKIIVVDNLLIDKPSTKKVLSMLDNLSISTKALLAMDEKNDNMIKSVNNVDIISLIASDSMNVVDLMKNDILIINVKGVEKLEQTYKYEF